MGPRAARPVPERHLQADLCCFSVLDGNDLQEQGTGLVHLSLPGAGPGPVWLRGIATEDLGAVN